MSGARGNRRRVLPGTARPPARAAVAGTHGQVHEQRVSQSQYLGQGQKVSRARERRDTESRSHGSCRESRCNSAARCTFTLPRPSVGWFVLPRAFANSNCCVSARSRASRLLFADHDSAIARAPYAQLYMQIRRRATRNAGAISCLAVPLFIFLPAPLSVSLSLASSFSGAAGGFRN